MGTIYEADKSYISSVIFIVFLFFSAFNFFLALSMGKPENLVDAGKRLSISDWFSRKFTTMGLLGTIVGIIFLLSNSLGGDDTSVIIAQLWTGLGTALYTTGCGVVANFFLSLQNFIIDYDL